MCRAAHVASFFNPLTVGAAYILVFIFYSHIKYHILKMLKKKCDINRQDLKRVEPRIAVAILDLYWMKMSWSGLKLKKIAMYW